MIAVFAYGSGFDETAAASGAAAATAAIVAAAGDSHLYFKNLVSALQSDGDGADYFVRKDIQLLLAECSDIDTVILGCTHYPLLIDKINKYMPADVQVVQQGPIVADSLADYLRRHPEIERHCSRGGSCNYYTTEDPDHFSPLASVFVNEPVDARRVIL